MTPTRRCHLGCRKAPASPLATLVCVRLGVTHCPDFRSSWAHSALIDRIGAGQRVTTRLEPRKPVGTRLWPTSVAPQRCLCLGVANVLVKRRCRVSDRSSTSRDDRRTARPARRSRRSCTPASAVVTRPSSPHSASPQVSTRVFMIVCPSSAEVRTRPGCWPRS